MEEEKYFCINCKKYFKEIPEKKINECITGYYHKLVITKKLNRLVLKR